MLHVAGQKGRSVVYCDDNHNYAPCGIHIHSVLHCQAVGAFTYNIIRSTHSFLDLVATVREIGSWKLEIGRVPSKWYFGFREGSKQPSSGVVNGRAILYIPGTRDNICVVGTVTATQSCIF